MQLITAEEARKLVELGQEWRKNNLVDILEKTMNDIGKASLVGKKAITIESISNQVNLSAFQNELTGLGFNVKILSYPWPPRCIEISW